MKSNARCANTVKRYYFDFFCIRPCIFPFDSRFSVDCVMHAMCVVQCTLYTMYNNSLQNKTIHRSDARWDTALSLSLLLVRSFTSACIKWFFLSTSCNKRLTLSRFALRFTFVWLNPDKIPSSPPHRTSGCVQFHFG